MDVKPEGLAEAEKLVSEDLVSVLELAYATDILPLLARHNITQVNVNEIFS